MIRNTPYGKRIQSKLQRDQFDATHSSGAYGTGGFSRPYPQTSMRRSSQIDPYMQGSTMYGVPQAGPQQMVSTPLIPAQVRHVAPQPMDPYSSQTYGQPRNGVAGLVNSQYSHVAPSYTGSMNGNAGYINSSMPDPYQRAAYPYV